MSVFNWQFAPWVFPLRLKGPRSFVAKNKILDSTEILIL